MRNIGTIIVLAIILLVVWGGIMIVDETEQIVIVQLGKPVRNITEPGLNFKVPFIQSATVFEKRLLEYDSAPNTILTEDKKNLILDNYAQWRISDPLKFMQTMRTQALAQSRLDDIIYSSLRVQLGTHLMHEIVSTMRDSLMHKVTQNANMTAADYGIEIVDVRIKRADLPRENEQAVFDRMKAERERMAKQFRSEGDEEAVKIRAETDKDREIILADAYKAAQEIRGAGEAQAIRIYANAYSRDQDFYEFTRTMEAYKKVFDDKTKLVLTPESEFLSYLKEMK
ncbi:MAG: protease modulator HflC [Candidatus Marinimicrobia bacterium]|jgi:membrane protease subunit HflC|nr:protease modulator HflC [Candidatus Neomarinimicrobiota bacterium]MBT4360154.1 protease modulator HflC [Candidatus Neomarinimicrobiota bacterium]MBT4714089.1 protease modulator HflC [Candidatus Neomarinimicrobiota bacterium]MBT4944783.1 protease modulator HflC [Candidatus Neomarinimicrobiota bacterium]MBT5270436.1 protease modulator HflC [Candidatus Neomarinimicrobiota bacterium]